MLEPDSAPIYTVLSYVVVENKELPIVAGIDTCASSNIIARSHVPDGSLIMPTSDPKIKGANFGSLQIVGMVGLSMRLGEMERDVLASPAVAGNAFHQQVCSGDSMLRWRYPLDRWIPFTFARPR
jgi:hypothetical protein